MRVRTCLAVLIVLFALFFVGTAFSADLEETMTEGQFSDLCADANAAEVEEAITRLENPESVSLIPFMVAAATNHDPEVIEVLIEFFGKEAINQTIDDSKKTALIHAIENDNEITVIEALIRNGADVNQKDASGKSAVDYAEKHSALSANPQALTWTANYYANIEPSISDISEAESELEQESEAESESESEQEQEQEAESEQELEPSESDSESEPEQELEQEAESDSASETETESEQETESEPEQEQEATPEPEADIEPESKPEQESKTEPERKTELESEPKPTPEVEAKGIRDEDFMRMCSGAELAIIQNAITNRNANVNAKDYYDVTPIMLAAEKNSDPEIISVLAKAGADPNAHDKDGKTALMYAAKSNPNPEIIAALVSAGANINARDNNRVTALMNAARTNTASVVKALLDAGAEDLADKRGWTSLFWAARYTNDPAVIGVLLDAGADPMARAHDMTSPIDYANRNANLINTKEFLRLEAESR